MVADSEELKNFDASEIHARRLSAKEVFMPKNGDHFIFPIADGTVKLSGRDAGVRKSTLTRGDLQGISEKFQPMDETPDDAEFAMTFGHWKETSFIVITSNLEFNSTCRKKKHSQFR